MTQNQELLSRAIKARHAELLARVAASGYPSPTVPLQASRVGMRMPRHIRPQPGRARAYQPLPRY